MKIIFKNLIIICLLIAVCSSCKKKSSVVPDPVVIPDTTKPTITIVQPTAGKGYIAGNTIAFQATFSDNKELKNYDIAVSKVVTGGMVLKIVPTVVAFSYVKTATSLGSGVKQQEIVLSDIIIPANTATTIVATGKYNFKVTCTDAANNTAETILEININ